MLDSRLFRNVGKNSRFGKVNWNLCLPYTTTTSPSFIQDLATVFELNARRTEETRRSLLHEKNPRRCVLPFTCPEKSQRSLPKRSRFSRTIDFYFLWIIVTGCGWPPVALYNLGPARIFPDFNELLSRNDLENCSIFSLFLLNKLRRSFLRSSRSIETWRKKIKNVSGEK